MYDHIKKKCYYYYVYAVRIYYKSSCSSATLKNCIKIHRRGWRGHYGDVTLSLEQPSILDVPGVKERPARAHNIPTHTPPTTLNAEPLPCRLSLAGHWSVRRGRGWRRLDGRLSGPLLFYASVLSRKRAGGWRGQRWWCSKIGVIWGFASGEGRGWKDEEEEEEREKKSRFQLSCVTRLPRCLTGKLLKLHKLIKEKKMIM